MSQSSSGQAPAREAGNFEYLDPKRPGLGAEELKRKLLAKVIGQDEAVEQLVDIYDRHLAGLTNRSGPIANLLFLGPTGTGKTRLVEATAESLLGNEKALVKVDCAEFQHSHEIAKLIGSPPGYLGHRETHAALSQEALDQFHTPISKIGLVLFDEVEKASDALWNLLLGILDKATLTLGDNRKVDFSHTIVFMTSNLGAAEMEATMRPNVGFTAGDVELDRVAGAAVDDKFARIGFSAARRKFTPEFINRLDKILVFRSLGDVELRRILDLEVRTVQQRALESGTTPFVFYLTETAKDVVIAEGTDAKYGRARSSAPWNAA